MTESYSYCTTRTRAMNRKAMQCTATLICCPTSPARKCAASGTVDQDVCTVAACAPCSSARYIVAGQGPTPRQTRRPGFQEQLLIAAAANRRVPGPPPSRSMTRRSPPGWPPMAARPGPTEPARRPSDVIGPLSHKIAGDAAFLTRISGQ